MKTIEIKLMQKTAMKNAALKSMLDLCALKFKRSCKIHKKLDTIIIEATKCWLKHVGGSKYQVACGPANQYVADLNL